MSFLSLFMMISWLMPKTDLRKMNCGIKSDSIMEQFGKRPMFLYVKRSKKMDYKIRIKFCLVVKAVPYFKYNTDVN